MFSSYSAPLIYSYCEEPIFHLIQCEFKMNLKSGGKWAGLEMDLFISPYIPAETHLVSIHPWQQQTAV